MKRPVNLPLATKIMKVAFVFNGAVVFFIPFFLAEQKEVTFGFDFDRLFTNLTEQILFLVSLVAFSSSFILSKHIKKKKDSLPSMKVDSNSYGFFAARYIALFVLRELAIICGLLIAIFRLQAQVDSGQLVDLSLSYFMMLAGFLSIVFTKTPSSN